MVCELIEEAGMITRSTDGPFCATPVSGASISTNAMTAASAGRRDENTPCPFASHSRNPADEGYGGGPEGSGAAMLTRLLPILGITFIDIFGFSILIPILPFFVKHFGSSDLTVGLLFSTFAACQFIAGPIWGNISDRIGRKTVLIISQIGATIGWTMLAFANTIGLVFLARVVEGISGGNISVTQAYVADLVEPKDRARAFAYVGAAFSAGIVFGPALGGFLLSRYGFSAPFLTAAAIQLVTLLLTIFMLPESTSQQERSNVAGFGDIWASLTNRKIAPLLIQLWAFSLSLYAWFAVFTLLLKEGLSMGAADVSYLFASFGVVSVILQVGVTGNVNDMLGARRSANIGMACLLLGFLL